MNGASDEHGGNAMEGKLARKGDRASDLPATIWEREWILPVIFGAAGTFIIMLSIIKYGPGATHASVNYLSALSSLVKNLSMVQFDGRYFHEYAPLYPILSAIPILLGMDPLAAGGAINVAAFGLIAGIFLHLQRKMGMRAAIVILGSFLVLFSKPLFQVSTMAWDTTLLILFTLLFLYWMGKFLTDGERRGLIIASASASLAVLSNYDGAVLIIAGFIVIMFRKGANLKARLGNLAVFIAISAAPIGAYLIRNILRTGYLIGQKGPSAYSLLDNVLHFLSSTGNWFFPGFIPSILISAVILSFFILVVILWRKMVNDPSLPDRTRNTVTTAFSVLVIFVIFLLVTRSMIGMGSLDTKICAPLFIPSLLIFLPGLDRMISGGNSWMRDPRKGVLDQRIQLSRNGKRRFRMIAFALMVIVILSAASVGLSSRILIERGAGGYNTDRWRSSDLMERIGDMEINESAYSNAPDAIYLLLDVKGIALSPREHLYSSTEGTDDMELLKEDVANGGPAVLIWFDNVTKGYLIGLPEIEDSFETEIVLKASDGEILRLLSVKTEEEE